MKKKIILSLSIFIGVCILVFSFINTNSAHTDPSLTKDKVKELVQEQYPGEVDEPVLRTEDNEPIYTVKLTHDDHTYHLKLDGNSGEVLDITKKLIKKPKVVDEKENSSKQETTKNNETNPKPKKELDSNKKAETKENTESKVVSKPKVEKQVDSPKKEKKTVISEAEVKKIALQQFSGVIEDIDLEEDNGRLIYEVEIENGDREAEVEIDAYTGEVILIEIDED